ncbi:hypothetical protein OPKNFCMD_5251 [Methylobacterium crusticola]|uniref:Uncharacterized protein n=1 Tax=Methylobacterium crusticola TaxID=1697972 RepID=A0ABQ4R471_9HYPH|nr:hypothetical protein [Methylobacterium crusticola]GJD52485.1 hypothetical protein OPKNFCMD_5251 [Methylobacterium crusticola]
MTDISPAIASYVVQSCPALRFGMVSTAIAIDAQFPLATADEIQRGLLLAWEVLASDIATELQPTFSPQPDSGANDA